MNKMCLNKQRKRGACVMASVIMLAINMSNFTKHYKR